MKDILQKHFQCLFTARIIPLILLISLFFSSLSYGNIDTPIHDAYGNMHILSTSNDNKVFNLNMESQNKELETPFRRFEIAFLLSLPFVFIFSYLTLNIFDVIKEGDFVVDVWGDYKNPLLISTLVLTSSIAIREAYIYKRTYEKKNISLKEIPFYFSFIKRY